MYAEKPAEREYTRDGREGEENVCERAKKEIGRSWRISFYRRFVNFRPSAISSVTVSPVKV